MIGVVLTGPQEVVQQYLRGWELAQRMAPMIGSDICTRGYLDAVAAIDRVRAQDESINERYAEYERHLAKVKQH